MGNLYNLSTRDQVEVCHNSTCIKARGQNAELLTIAFTFVLVCAGIAILAKQ